jgi:aspartyl aminopeptidase
MADVFQRIRAFYEMTDEDYICMKTDSLCASRLMSPMPTAPNFAKKYDPQHQLMPGHGIVIKYNADKKYVTDAKTAAPVISACKKAKLPLSVVCLSLELHQRQHHRSDLCPYHGNPHRSTSALPFSRCIRRVK